MPGWLELVNDASYMFGSAVFQYMEYLSTKKVRQKTFIFQNVSQANMVNMNGQPLHFILTGPSITRLCYFQAVSIGYHSKILIRT
jgi:hypothetical protein